MGAGGEEHRQGAGSHIFVGTKKIEQTSVHVMDYGPEQLNERDFADVNQIKDLHSSSA